MPSKKEYSLIEAIEAVSSQLKPELDIVTVQITGPAKLPVVRVYIDHPDGVGFDLLCDTQKWVSEILDEIDPFPGAYTLEVSSPGPQRALRKAKHFQNAVGKLAKIQTTEAIDGRQAFTGYILLANTEEVKIELDEGKANNRLKYSIPLNLVKKANLKE